MDKVSYVALNRAEGPTELCGAVVFVEAGQERPVIEDKHFNGAKYVYFKGEELLEAVVRKMSEWGETAPEGGGYDKVDFQVGWTNGLNYGGRFDMEYGGKENGETFWASLKRRVEVYALKFRPAHFNDKQWKGFCERMSSEGFSKECQDILDRCELAA